ncbi:MAG TPA: glycoside hydrolase, partial [bacterium]
KALEAKGVGVIVGEWGSYNKTPHEVALRWMEDCLQNWQEAGWGWALWNFKGEFGVMDSHRADVQYEDFQGHQLDRKMLELLQKY